MLNKNLSIHLNAALQSDTEETDDLLPISFVGQPLESLKKCAEFYNRISSDPVFSSDVVPRYYLATSLAVMYVLSL